MEFNLHRLRGDIANKKGDKMSCIVAKEIGISKSTMSRLENVDGFKPDMKNFVQILTWLGTEPNRYFDYIYNVDNDKVDGWEASLVECDLCRHRWVAVRPEGLTKLECPMCHNISNFENISA